MNKCNFQKLTSGAAKIVAKLINFDVVTVYDKE